MNRDRVAVVGIDLAKNVFQIHGSDASGRAILRRQLTRAQVLPFLAQLPPCLIGMEACGGAHHWARQIRAFGHQVRLMAPQFVKPYVKTNKDDRADAEAIAEAVTRPGMRFVAIKESWQQDLLSVHRVRERLVKNRTALTNEIRGLLGENGIVFGQGTHRLRDGLTKLLGCEESGLSDKMRFLLQQLLDEWRAFEQRLDDCEAMIKDEFQSRDICRRLQKLEGIGPITATAFVATIGDPAVFRNGRQMSAYLGLVPRHDGSGGKNRNKGISKRGDRYVRKLLVHGARAVLRVAHANPDRHRWVAEVDRRRGFNKACVALANKNARRCWAIMSGHERRVER